jgi:hypothetical protein
MLSYCRALGAAAFAVAPGAAHAACLLPGQVPMLVVTLYFGESIPGRAPLTAAEWSAFAAKVITPAFPDGFTVTDGDGQWMDDATHEIVREQSKVLTVAVVPGPGLAARVGGVMAAYDKAFEQSSVGVTTAEVCGAF